ncbi:MAG: DUF401 family protein [bacterium]|nr:DUF401 family protein [bacterium]
MSIFVPLTVKVLGALASILAANTLLGNLLTSLLIGILVLGVWCGYSPAALYGIIWRQTLTIDNLLLLVAVYQVISLSLLMKAAGRMDSLVEYVRRRISKRLSLAALPAIIGLLPMPGGALFSAPLVESCDHNDSVTPIQKITINYWFRHMWEFWWPLYPGVILAVELSGLEIWQYMLVQLPFSLVAVVIGYVFFLKGVTAVEEKNDILPASDGYFKLLSILSPIAVTILIYALIMIGWVYIRPMWPALPAMQKYVPMIIGLAAAMVLLRQRSPLEPGRWREILFARRTGSILALVVMIRAFGALVESDLPNGTPLVASMQAELFSWNVPLVLVIAIIPLIAGLSTGLSVGFVGASFPIIMNLIGKHPPFPLLLATASLAYCAGFVGMLLSPVHVCLIATNHHFRTRLNHSLWRLLFPSLLLLAAAVGYYMVLR